MKTKFFLLALALALAPALSYAQNKPVLVVHVFTLAPKAVWPYEMNQMQLQTVTELKLKDGEKFEVATEPPKDVPPNYILDGEVLEWHAGNRATRMFVGMGAGRETAKIHYWLTDKDGKKVFEHTDTIRQAFWGNAYAPSVNQLAQPFADKIAGRLADAKLGG